MPITDDFDGGTNGDELDTDSNWEHLYDGGSGGTSDSVQFLTDGGGLNITLNQYGFDGGHATGFWTRTESGGFPDDQYAEVVKDTDDSGMMPLVRADSAGDGYGATVGGGALRALEFNTGTLTTLSSTFPTTAVGDVVTIDATGTTILVQRNNSSTNEVSVTDSTHTEGVPGLWTNGSGSGNGVELDDFECSDEEAGGDATALPAVIAATTTAPASTVSVGAAPATVANPAALPTPTVVQAATATPAVINAITAALDSTIPAQVFPNLPLTFVSMTSPTIAADALRTPATIDASVASPLSFESVGATHIAVDASTALPTPTAGQVGGGDITATPAVIASIASVGAVDVSVGAVTAAIDALASLPLPTTVVDLSAAPAAVAVVASVAQPVVDVGAAPGALSLSVSTPAPTILVGFGSQPATIDAVVVIPDSPVSVGAAAAVIASLVALPAVAFVGQAAVVTDTVTRTVRDIGHTETVSVPRTTEVDLKFTDTVKTT